MTRLFEDDDIEVVLDAIDAWGITNQENVAVEELAEMIEALAKKDRGRVGNDYICGEIADTIIMANQLAIIYGPDRVDEAIDVKLDRLRGRIEDDSPSG